MVGKMTHQDAMRLAGGSPKNSPPQMPGTRSGKSELDMGAGIYGSPRSQFARRKQTRSRGAMTVNSQRKIIAAIPKMVSFTGDHQDQYNIDVIIVCFDAV